MCPTCGGNLPPFPATWNTGGTPAQETCSERCASLAQGRTRDNTRDLMARLADERRHRGVA